MQTNQQPPESRVQGDGSQLAVNSIFHTIQGEGPFAGTPAVFLRLAGCNLQCPLCDTEYSARIALNVPDILERVRTAIPRIGCGPAAGDWQRAPTNLVVITGGEPMRQPIAELVWTLLDCGYLVQIETNGTLFQPALPTLAEGLTIVCSPKTGNVHRQLVPWVKAWKYVARAADINLEDGLPNTALAHPATKLYRPPADHVAPIYLQPVDEQDTEVNEINQLAVVESCLMHGHRLCLQMHKIVGVP